MYILFNIFQNNFTVAQESSETLSILWWIWFCKPLPWPTRENGKLG